MAACVLQIYTYYWCTQFGFYIQSRAVAKEFECTCSYVTLMFRVSETLNHDDQSHSRQHLLYNVYIQTSAVFTESMLWLSKTIDTWHLGVINRTISKVEVHYGSAPCHLSVIVKMGTPRLTDLVFSESMNVVAFRNVTSTPGTVQGGSALVALRQVSEKSRKWVYYIRIKLCNVAN